MLIDSAQVRSPHTSVICISTTHSLSPEIVTLLCTFLPTIASAHPDPLVRHQASESFPLSSHSRNPIQGISSSRTLLGIRSSCRCALQPWVPVKETIIESLSTTKPNLFASPLFLRVFVLILFMPSPPDLFSGSKELPLSTFQESSEPQQLVECLAPSCVLVQRDNRNLVR